MVYLNFMLIIGAESRFPNFVNCTCNTNINLSSSDTGNSLEAFTTSRLIPLNKTPRVCSISVGKVLTRIARKVVMYIAKKAAIRTTYDV